MNNKNDADIPTLLNILWYDYPLREYSKIVKYGLKIKEDDPHTKGK